jgi:iron complex transport system substrate-binding protein
MKICSFLPSGTEILFALGLGDSVCGVTFECDYPAEARSKPVVVYSKLPPGLREKEIDTKVKGFSQCGESLYRLDAEKLREIQPDVIVTQDLCHVCAASPNDLGAILYSLARPPQVIALTPHRVDDVLQDVQTVGDACERSQEAAQLVSHLKKRISEVKNELRDPPRVLCLEWLDPPFVGGHWVPEMVALAGGIDVLGKRGEPGYEVDWPTITAADPDIILAAPCGFHRKEIEHELAVVPFSQAWFELRAVRNGNVFAMEASGQFSRPAPRIVEGIAEMAELFGHFRHEKKKTVASAVAPALSDRRVRQ